MASLEIDFQPFTFIDIGSGKGRVLLMAADYPFRRVLGVELFPSLNRIAQKNLSSYKSESQCCFVLETICGDAREFVFPPEPIVLYLFNPLPESALIEVVANLEHSLRTISADCVRALSQPIAGTRTHEKFIIHQNCSHPPALAISKCHVDHSK